MYELIFVLVLSIILILIGIMILFLQPKMMKTMATVTGKNNSLCLLNKNAYCELNVKYNVNDKEYNNKLFRKQIYYEKPGDQVKIQYNVKQPGNIVSNNAYKIAYIFMFVLGAVFFIIFGYMLWNKYFK